MALLTNPRNSMHRSHPHHSLMLLLLLLPLFTQGCVEEERQALLELKRGFVDHSNYLESWNSSSSSQEDCCGWLGIKCIWNGEGHVIISLDLSAAGLSGKISPSLHSLKHLEYLGLGGNHFLQGTPIPAFIGNFSNLTTLYLFGFGGAIPPQLGMLRNLEELHLSDNHFLQGTPIPAFIGNFSNLTTLYLSGFEGAIPPQLGMLRNLKHLDLRYNDFQGAPIPPFIGNFSNLTRLLLAGAGFGGAIPPQLGMLRNLKHLDLSGNDFLQGTPIPAFIGNLSKLTTLYLSGFGGAIPPQLGMLKNLMSLIIFGSLNSTHPLLFVQDFQWVSNLTSLNSLQFQNVDMGRVSDWEFSLSRLPFLQDVHLESCNLTSLHHGGILPSQSSGNGFASLQSLYLSHNKQLGKSFFPTWFFSLNNLSSLTLEDCSLDGVLTEHHFGSNLTSLDHLDMSDNPLLHIRIAPDWVPSFNLSFLNLSSCQVGPRFPLWLRTQENLESLILSSAGLRDSLPTWIWGFSSTLSYLDLSSNNFTGQLPALSPSEIRYLDLSHNSLCLSRFLCQEGLGSTGLYYLDLDNNLFSGNMSDCWDRWTSLNFVPEKCDQGDASSTTVNEHDARDYKDDSLVGLYIAFPIGFGAGASTMFIILLFQSSWRFSFFYFIDRTLNKLF